MCLSPSVDWIFLRVLDGKEPKRSFHVFAASLWQSISNHKRYSYLTQQLFYHFKESNSKWTLWKLKYYTL